MRAKPASSAAPKRVWSQSAESMAAVAGSRQPMSVARSGPMYLTPRRKIEKPPAVPTRTMTAISAKALASRPSGRSQTRSAIPGAAPPMSIPQPVMSALPYLAVIGREKSV